MKPRLIILSDLWGRQRSEWINTYTHKLNDSFDLVYYDCCELGEIDISSNDQDIIHSQFIQSGIEKASERLLELEKGEVSILAFSIGGVIAWRAGLEGVKINRYYIVSSTRLRNETKKPIGDIKVYFGSQDNFKPSLEWYDELNITNYIIENQYHEMYREDEFADRICIEIIGDAIKGND